MKLLCIKNSIAKTQANEINHKKHMKRMQKKT